ncbi:MAG: GAF domain-containing protein [Anaerolineae bacterium]
MSSEATGERFDLDAWRSMVTDRLLLFISALGGLVVLSSFVQALGEPQWWSQTAPFLVIYGLLLGLMLLRHRLDYHIRAWVLLLMGYAVGVIYLAILGLVGNGTLFLVVLPALGLVILGRNSGMIMALLSVLIYLAFTIAAGVGLLDDWLIIRENSLQVGQWLSQGLSAALVLVALVVLLVRFLAVQVTALSQARAAAEEMAEARDALQVRTGALDHYTHLLETTAEIVRQVSMLRQREEMLDRAVYLLVERLGVEQAAAYAVEQTEADEDSLGEGALRLRPTSIVAGGRQPSTDSPVGEAPEGEPVVPLVEAPTRVLTAAARAAAARPTASQAVRVDGGGSSSEIVLLLRSGGMLLAVLHLVGGALARELSDGEQGGTDDLAVLEVMADQLAVALENARQFEQAEARLRELDAWQRHYTLEAWQRFMVEHGKAAYHWQPLGPQAAAAPASPRSQDGLAGRDDLAREVWGTLFEQAQAEGRAVKVLDEDSGRHLLAMPVRLRDEVIGMLGFHRPRDAGSWRQEEIAAIEVVVGRMAFAAENLRLLEDAQRRAARDRLIEEIAGQVQDSLDPDNILKTAVRELGRALEAEWAAIELTGPEEVRAG